MGVSDVSHISAFRVFKTNLRKAFANYQSPHLLLDVLLSWSTTRFSSVKVEHNERYTGKSNYNFRRLFNQALLILTGYSTAPLRLASFIGFMFAFLGLCILLYALGIYFLYGGIVPGFTFLASLIAIFSGAQMFALGLIGEYLGRIFNRSMERPTYVVGSTCGGNSEDWYLLRIRKPLLGWVFEFSNSSIIYLSRRIYGIFWIRKQAFWFTSI